MRFSFSQLSTFKQCPKKWKFRYIDKLPVKESEILEKGKKVHFILEHFEDFLQKKLSDEYYNCKESEIVLKFAKSELGKDILLKKSLREYEIKFNDNFEPTLENEKFIGYIDRINISDKLELIDFKTGKYKEIQYQDYSQLIIYAIYMFQKFKNIDKILLRFIYVEHLLENSLELNRDSLEVYKKDFLNQIKNIENCNDFKANISKLCNWCDFKDSCSDFKIF